MAKLALSVIIPTYNRVETLEECLRSLFNQTLPMDRYEIIVIDDGSTDDTQKFLSDISKESPVTFRFFGQPNRGPAAARNLGIREAAGEIVFITGDDIIATDNLLKEHLDSHNKYDGMAVLGRTEWHPGIQITDFMEYIATSGHQFAYNKIKDPFALPYVYFYTSNISLHKRWFEKAGYFDEDFPYAAYEDTELGYRMQKNGLKIIYNEKALAYHKHSITLDGFCERQKKAGESGYIFYLKYPELASTLGVDKYSIKRNLNILKFKTLANIFKFIGLKEAYYSAILSYYYRLGVKKRLERRDV